jgi:hypothetical protein
MKWIAICCSLSFLFGTAVLAQNWQPVECIWTDKNNNEQHAAYLLRSAYYEEGIAEPKSKLNRMAQKGFLSWSPEKCFMWAKWWSRVCGLSPLAR